MIYSCDVVYGRETCEKFVEEQENISDDYYDPDDIVVSDYYIAYEECLISYTVVGLEEEETESLVAKH